MNREQFAEVLKAHEVGPIRAIDFTGAERTLLYGYTCERYTWHVYLKDGLIHVAMFDHRDVMLSHSKATEWDPEDLVPDKRVYPESSDMQLARTLRGVVDVPYGRFDNVRYERVKNLLFHGKIAD